MRMTKTFGKLNTARIMVFSLLAFLAGLLVLAQSYKIAELDLSLVNQRYGVFWAGLSLSYFSIIFLIYKITPLNKPKVFLILVLLTLVSYAPKIFLGIYDPIYFDEKIHIAHAQNILDDGSFFITNSMNPPISAYPVTQSLLISISSLTTLSLYTSGIILLLACHFFTLFLIYKISRVLKLPTTFAILASVVYSIAPGFWFNGAQVSYQPVAFPIALGALFFLLKYLTATVNGERKRYLVFYVTLTILTIVTHHATAIILGMFLVLGGIVCFFIKDRNSIKLSLLGLGTAVTSAGWYIVNNPTQVDYLIPSQAINALLVGNDGESTSRAAFSGSDLPIYEQLAGYVGPIIVFVVACTGFWLGRHLIKPVFMKYLLGVVLVSYPLSFPFTLISETNVLAHRIWPYQYLAVSILAGIGLGLGWKGYAEVYTKIKTAKFNFFRQKSFTKTSFSKSKESFIITIISLLVIGIGNAALDGNDTLRFPVSGSESKTVNNDTKILGAWFTSNYGNGARITGDTDTINDLHLYGKTWIIKEVPLWELTFKEGNNFNDALGLMKLKNVEFFVVNTDILEKRPKRGYYYSTYEPNAYGVDPGLTLERVNSTPGLTQIKTQGKYIVYKVNPEEILLTSEQLPRLSGEITEKAQWLEERYNSNR